VGHLPKSTFYRLRDEKQEGILRAAIHEFVKHGFNNAKISDIAKRAGVATGSIYQYFEDKSELFVYCAKWGLEVYMKKLSGRTDMENMDIFEYFQDNISKMEIVNEERELALFMQAITKVPDLVDDSLKAMYEAGDEYIKTLIKNSKNKGSVRADVDDELLKEYFIAVTERFRMRWVRQYVDFTKTEEVKSNLELQRELYQMLKLLKNGMGR